MENLLSFQPLEVGRSPLQLAPFFGLSAYFCPALYTAGYLQAVYSSSFSWNLIRNFNNGPLEIIQWMVVSGLQPEAWRLRVLASVSGLSSCGQRPPDVVGICWSHSSSVFYSRCLLLFCQGGQADSRSPFHLVTPANQDLISIIHQLWKSFPTWSHTGNRCFHR